MLAARKFILSLYKTILERAPAAGEWESWTNTILAGMPYADARAAFLTSEEYIAKCGLADIHSVIESSGLFDAVYYTARYPDVATAGFVPIAHYCGHGRHESRAPNDWFDPTWYRDQLGLPPDQDVLLHYIVTGAMMDFPPGPYFDPIWYRRAYELGPDVLPLAHFLRHRGGGVAPNAALWAVSVRSPEHDPDLALLRDHADAGSADQKLLEGSGLFDANFYALHSSDVLEAGIDGLTHFCRFGWREGRDPNFYFKTTWYARTNPEVVRLGVNPLLHYLLAGEPAGRRPVVYFDPNWYRDTYGTGAGNSPLAHFLARRRDQTVSPTPLFDPAWYRARMGTALHANRDAFSHYLLAGTKNDVRPSAGFDAAAWRRSAMVPRGPDFIAGLSPERDNPLVHYLLATYD